MVAQQKMNGSRQGRETVLIKWLQLLLGVLLCCQFSLAQTSFSTVRGTVTDPTGAVVPGAEIALVHVERGAERKVTSNDAGEFEIPDLQRGTYRLTATSAGFQTYVAENIGLESDQIRRINVVLELGELATQITVSEGFAVITTDSAKIASGFTNERIEDAPILGDGRNPAIILSTMPFIQSANSLYGLRFAGQTSSQVQQGIDGHVSDGTNNQVSNIHDVQEIVSVAVNNTAEYSRVGYYNMVQKSGGNDWHGQASYWHANSALDARNTFQATKNPQKMHVWNGTVSGPIIKNRTFFYFANMGQKFPGGQFYLKDVPTQKMRAGDFSELLALSNPITLKDPSTGNPFPNNQIPSERLSSVSLKTQELYITAPNGPGLTRNLTFVHPYPNDIIGVDYLTGRIDHKISEKNTFYGRWTVNWGPYILARDYPGLSWTRNRHSHHLVFADTHVFSPSLVNSLRLGFYNEGVWDGETIDGFTPVRGDEVVSTLGIQGVNPQGLSQMGFPSMRITGYPDVTVRHGGQPISQDHNYGYYDAVTWSTGSHVIKIGGEWKPFSRFSATTPEGTYGIFTFNGSLTGHAYGDFLLGTPFSSQRLDPLTNRTLIDRELGLFVQDTFKVTNRLTLDLGLRWDHFGPSDWEDGLLYNWDPATGNVIVPQEAMSAVSPLYPTNLINVVAGEVKEKPYRGNFAPRLGVAYRFGNDLVVRGGYGIYTATNGRYTTALTGGPFELSETFFNSFANGAPAFAFPNPFPTGSGNIAAQSIEGYPLETENGRIHQFNLSIEKQVKDIGLRFSYVGSRNRGMNYDLNINRPQASLTPFSASRRPYSQFVNTTYRRTDGEQNYNAFNFQVVRKIKGLTFDNHYTWSSNLLNNQSIEDPYAPLQWSRDPNTIKHRLVLNVVWELPVGRGRRFMTNAPKVVDHILGGWSLYWLGYMESGYYFTPSFSGADPSNTNSFGGRPDRIANGNLSTGQRSIDRWFDPSAFAAPPAGRYGNSGAYILEGPGYNGQDLSILKQFNITERVKFTLIGAMENFPNHPNYGLPASNISVPGQVAQISGTKGGDFGARRKVVIRTRIDF